MKALSTTYKLVFIEIKKYYYLLSVIFVKSFRYKRMDPKFFGLIFQKFKKAPKIYFLPHFLS